MKKMIVIGEDHVSLKDILDISVNFTKVQISTQSQFLEKLKKSQAFLDKNLEQNVPVYGVTTGYGKCCHKRVVKEVAIKNGDNLIRFHGCGTGDFLDIPDVRASMVCRLICISRGYSAVSLELLEQLAAFINNNIIPLIPCEGSVGASGDLTPLSYIAATLKGERDVLYQGERMSSLDAMKIAGLTPYSYKPKEQIAMMNGTSIMTGIAICAIDRAQKIIRASIQATALTIHALKGNAHHYHGAIMDAKPFPGQRYVAEQIVSLLDCDDHKTMEDEQLETLQDPYSVRCAPHIVGVLTDALEWIIPWVELEANSSNDNPILDPETGELLMGGNFYGGHIAFAMDSFKSAIASIADMADRQVMLLVDRNVNRGLPSDLVNVPHEEEMMYNHGFKGMSISASALTAEALKLTFPAASFSRSTESHNQDKVSMGTIAARDAKRICELTERVVAILLMAASQACDIRGNIERRPNIKKIHDNIRSLSEVIVYDREMDKDIVKIVSHIRSQEW
ncbi:MAG: aromatic amino acid ammonia-lyase [Spirochaetes bacterium]|jgi:histidine ammonia-lyase|nr:aromatic amino acid ammonia-lyase [Spirochaetota bacterium]